MATYFVRDTIGYVTIVEADSFIHCNLGSYEFITRNAAGNPSDTVASFPDRGVVSVVEAEKAFQDIFLHDGEVNDPDTGDPDTDDFDPENSECPLLDEFLDSEAFITAVAEIAADVVEEYHSNPCQGNPVPTEITEGPATGWVPPVLTVIEGTLKSSGETHYGFIIPDQGFAPFGGKEEDWDIAKNSLDAFKSGDTNWAVNPVDYYTFSEADNV